MAIPDIAMPAVRRLVDSGAAGRERSEGKLYAKLINGERGGYRGYAMWRRYLKLAHGYTAAHEDGIVKYTAHELRHVCASLLIASGATDMQVANQMGHSKIETTKNVSAITPVRLGPRIDPQGDEPGGNPPLRPVSADNLIQVTRSGGIR